jgi:hypothetical protein
VGLQRAFIGQAERRASLLKNEQGKVMSAIYLNADKPHMIVQPTTF